MREPKFAPGPDLVKLIAEIDEFKGRWGPVNVLRAKERLTIAELAAITRANRNTLKVRLRELVADGRVRRRGKARATWYSL